MKGGWVGVEKCWINKKEICFMVLITENGIIVDS